MANSISLTDKTFFVISGASQGIGQQMAIECSRNFATGSIVVLLARQQSGLDETKRLIELANATIEVKTFSIDLTSPSNAAISAILTEALQPNRASDFRLAFVVHNVGTIGDITKLAHEIDSVAMWQDYYSLNVFSVATLNAQFVNMFREIGHRRLVVNVTSKCSSVPFNSFAMYCTSRAAREMYFKVLATEKRGEELLVLNYSPGMCDTQMTIDVQDLSADSGIREYFSNTRRADGMIRPVDTARRMIEVLELGNFESGDYVDYHDKKE